MQQYRCLCWHCGLAWYWLVQWPTCAHNAQRTACRITDVKKKQNVPCRSPTHGTPEEAAHSALWQSACIETRSCSTVSGLGATWQHSPLRQSLTSKSMSAALDVMPFCNKTYAAASLVFSGSRGSTDKMNSDNSAGTCSAMSRGSGY